MADPGGILPGRSPGGRAQSSPADDMLAELRLDPAWSRVSDAALVDGLARLAAAGEVGGIGHFDPEAGSELWDERGIVTEGDLAAWLQERGLDEDGVGELLERDAMHRSAVRLTADQRDRDLRARLLLSPEYPRLRHRASDKRAQLTQLGLLDLDRPVDLDYQELLTWWVEHRPHLAPSVLAEDRSRDPFRDESEFRRDLINEYHYVTCCEVVPWSTAGPRGRLRDEDMVTSTCEWVGAFSPAWRAFDDLDRFGRDCWDQEPMHAAADGSFDPSSLLDLADLDHLLTSFNTSARLLDRGVYVPRVSRSSEGPGTEQHGHPLAVLLSGLRAGQSIVIDAVDLKWPKIGELAAQLRSALSAEVSTKAFVAPPGTVTDWHCDETHNVVLQLHGTKHWFVDRDVGADQGDGQGLLHAALEPGDVLYLPRRFHHTVRNGPQLSVHVTFSCTRATWRARLLDVIAAGLAETEGSLPHTPPDPSWGPASAARADCEWQAALVTVAEVVEGLDAIAEQPVAGVARPERPTGHRAVLAACLSVGVEPTSTFRLRPGVVTAAEATTETIVLRRADVQLDVPGWLEPAIDFISDQEEPRVVAEVPVDTADAVMLVKRLVADRFAELMVPGSPT